MSKSKQNKILAIIILLVSASIILIPRYVLATTLEDEVIVTEQVIEPVVIYCNSFDDIKEYARCRVTEEWSESQWVSFDKIISKESMHWKINTAHNPSLSSAYGLGGFLDSTWKTVGCVKTSDKQVQVDCAIKYIKDRYSTPDNAYEFHTLKNWY